MPQNATKCHTFTKCATIMVTFPNLSSTPPKITYEPPPYVIPANAGIQ